MKRHGGKRRGAGRTKGSKTSFKMKKYGHWWERKELSTTEAVCKQLGEKVTSFMVFATVQMANNLEKKPETTSCQAKKDFSIRSGVWDAH